MSKVGDRGLLERRSLFKILTLRKKINREGEHTRAFTVYTLVEGDNVELSF